MRFSSPCQSSRRPRLSQLALLWATCLLALPTAAAPKARVTVFLFADSETPVEVRSTISTTLAKALKQDPNLEVKDSDHLLVEYAGEIPSEDISAAMELQQQALTLLKDGDPQAAIKRLEQAIPQLEQVLPFIKKHQLAQAFLALGVAQATARQPRRAVATFRQLLVWRPFAKYDLQTFPAELVPLFEQARQQVQQLKRGSVELNTEPPGARAFIDGRQVGISPTVAFGLTVGEHYLTYKQTGYIKSAEKITVSPRKQLSYSTTLRRSEKYLLLEQSLASIRQDLGQPQASPDMVSLNTLLFIDQVVFVTVAGAGTQQLKIGSTLYDLRSKLRLNQASMTADRRQLGKDLKRLARLLYLNVRYDGSLLAPPEPPPPPPPKRTPFYASWWFWTAIAVGSAGVVIPIIYWPEGESWPAGQGMGVIRN